MLSIYLILKLKLGSLGEREMERDGEKEGGREEKRRRAVEISQS